MNAESARARSRSPRAQPLSVAQIIRKATNIVKDYSAPLLDQLGAFLDKLADVLEEDKKTLADEGIGLAKALHEYDGSSELVQYLLDTARKFHPERLEKDVLEFHDCAAFASILRDCSDDSVMRLIEDLDPCKAERVAHFLGDELLRRKILP